MHTYIHTYIHMRIYTCVYIYICLDVLFEAGENSGPKKTKYVPPAICLCQPSELTSHERDRWEMQMEYVDEAYKDIYTCR